LYTLGFDQEWKLGSTTKLYYEKGDNG